MEEAHFEDPIVLRWDVMFWAKPNHQQHHACKARKDVDLNLTNVINVVESLALSLSLSPSAYAFTMIYVYYL